MPDGREKTNQYFPYYVFPNTLCIEYLRITGQRRWFIVGLLTKTFWKYIR